MDKTDLWFIFYHFQYFQSFLLRQTRTCWPVRSHWSFLCINGHLILLIIFSLGSSLRLSQTDKQIKQSHKPFKWKFSTTTYNIWMPNPNHRIEGGGVGERAGGGKGRGGRAGGGRAGGKWNYQEWISESAMMGHWLFNCNCVEIRQRINVEARF